MRSCLNSKVTAYYYRDDKDNDDDDDDDDYFYYYYIPFFGKFSVIITTPCRTQPPKNIPI